MTASKNHLFIACFGRVDIYDLNTQQKTSSIILGNNVIVKCMCYNPTKQVLYVATCHEIFVLDLLNIIKRWVIMDIGHMQLIQNDSVILLQTVYKLMLIDSDTAHIIKFWDMEIYNTFALDEANDLLYIPASRGVFCYQWSTLKKIKLIHADIKCLSKDGSRVLVTGGDHTIECYNLLTNEVTSVLKHQGSLLYYPFLLYEDVDTCCLFVFDGKCITRYY
jgi:WD40 repeat protein